MATNPTVKFAKQTYKKCKVLFGVTVTFCLLWCLWFTVQTYNHLFTPGMIEWVRGYETLQKGFMVLYWCIPFAYLLICIAFFTNLLNGLKTGTIFNQKCVKYLYALGIVYFFSDILISNIYNWSIKVNYNEIVLNPSFVAVPIIIFVFAILFQLACKVSEDSALAI